jgi:polyferredoxin
VIRVLGALATLLLAGFGPAAPAAAQLEPGAAPAAPASAASDIDEQPADDGRDFEEDADWGFEEEEEGDDPWSFGGDEEVVETWGALLRDQAADLALFTGFATLVLVGFFRKSVWMKYVTLAAAVGYLGFSKSQLISVVNVYGMMTGNMPVFRYSLAWYLFAVFTVVTTILWGRLYCGRVCAFGALTQLMDRVVPARLRVEVPPWLERRAAWIKYGLLGVTLLYFLGTADIPAYRFVEPFWMFTRRGSTAMWIGLAALLAATVFVRNLYCRFLCPVGAFLGLLSKATVFRIKRWKECDTCKICEKACEWGAIRGPQIVMTECVRCDDCERLYADVKKCPHWLLLVRAKLRQRRAAPSIPVRPVAST